MFIYVGQMRIFSGQVHCNYQVIPVQWTTTANPTMSKPEMRKHTAEQPCKCIVKREIFVGLVLKIVKRLPWKICKH